MQLFARIESNRAGPVQKPIAWLSRHCRYPSQLSFSFINMRAERENVHRERESISLWFQPSSPFFSVQAERGISNTGRMDMRMAWICGCHVDIYGQMKPPYHTAYFMVGGGR